MYKILLATDGSDYSLKSLQKIIPLARAMQADLTILTVIEEIPFIKGTGGMSREELEALYSSIGREAEGGLKKAADLFKTQGLEVKTKIRAGKPADMICEESQQGGFDLIALGDTGRGGLQELFLGSVSNKVAHCSKTDVIIVKRDQ